MITRLTRRFERRPLARPNLAYFLWRFAANGARTVRASFGRRSFSDSPAIARTLTSDGIVVGSADRFLSDEGRRALEAATAQVVSKSRSDKVQAVLSGSAPPKRTKEFRIDLVSQGIAGDSPLLQVALDPRLLEIVACYLGMWPCLHSVGAWLNYPTPAAATSSQLWHNDPEDLKIVKAFIYLEEVKAENGPFTYIPGTHPFGRHAARGARCHARRVDDAAILDLFAETDWRVCTGPAQTMILADTLGFHRGGKPDAGTRMLVTFTYTSGTPLVQPSIWLKDAPSCVSLPIQRAAVKRLGMAPPIKPEKAKSDEPRPRAMAASL